MTRRGGGTVLVALGAAAAGGLALGIPYGAAPARDAFLLLAPLGLLAGAVASLARARRRAIGGLRRQFAVAGAISVGLLVATMLVMVERMFVSAHDALVAAVAAGYAAAVGVWAARGLAHDALGDVEAVRGTLTAVADGRRDVRTDVPGRDELAALAQAVDAMVDRLGAEEDARRGLIAAVSHDLRTPITALRLLAEAIDDDLVDAATRREYTARMGTHVRALGALIDDLFELTRIDSGDLRWTLEQVELDDLVRETVDAMRPAADAGCIAVRAELGPGAAVARADPEKLQRVLFNLLQNAIRHTPADGSITVRAEPEGAHVRVEVADTGSGIAAADRERVFEPFVRAGADAARTEGGAGLGLAIARAIVEAHGGRIWFAEEARGTRVCFTLPAAA